MPLLRGPEIGLRLGERRLLCDEQSFGAHVQEVRLLDRQDDALEGRVVCPVRREQRFTGRADGARAAAEVEEEPRDSDAGPVGLLLRGTHAARGDPLDGLYRPAERDGGVVLPLGRAICRGSSPEAATPRVTGSNAREAGTLRPGTSGGRVAYRASIVLCAKGLGRGRGSHYTHTPRRSWTIPCREERRHVGRVTRAARSVAV